MKNVVFTQRVEIIESYNERRDCADQRISDFIYAAGYIPVPIPNRSEIAELLLGNIKPVGIVLTGGNSLVKYGGDAPERDAMDREMLQIAIEKNIPVYGFCRGMQSILDYFGNELINVEGHVAVRHTIHNAQGEGCEVNSYHKQACIKIQEECGLKVVAQTADGVIEEVRHKTYPIVGTMWHPERESAYMERDLELIRGLFK